MEIKVFVILAIITGLHSSNIRIYPSTRVTVKIGEGFSTFLTSDSNFGELLKCQIKLKSLKKTFDIPKVGSEPIETDFGTIEAFEESQCGAVVRNISLASKGDWELVAIDKNFEKISQEISVNILDVYDDEVKPQNVVGYPRSVEKVLCFNGDRYSNNRLSNCIIKDLQTGKEERIGVKTIVLPESGETNKYICLCKIKGSTTLIKQEVFAKALSMDKEFPTIKSSVQHLNQSTVLSCQFGHDKPNCFAIHLKSGRIINIEDNLVGPRYSSHKTYLQNGLCQLEIPHPIMKSETGVWKIVTYYSTRYDNTKENERGCFFKIESDGSEEIKELKNLVSNPQKITTIEEIITINCENAPYALKYCYLLSPNNSVIFNTQMNFEYSSSVGSCIFEDMKISSGLWKCGFNPPNENEMDIVQEIEIEYFPELQIKVESSTVKIDSNDSFSLMCRTVVDIPVKSCMFFSPNGDIYHLSDSRSKLYYGRGLNYGDCGITISTKDTSKHLGVWSCNVFVDSVKDPQLFGEILVVTNDIDKTKEFEENDYEYHK